MATVKRKVRLPSGFFDTADAGGVFNPTVGPQQPTVPPVSPEYAFHPSTPQTGPLRDAFAPDRTPYQGAQPDIVKDVYAPQLEDVANRYREALNAPHAGGFRQFMGAWLGNRNPMVGSIISGEYGRNRRIGEAGEKCGHRHKT